LVAEVKTKGFIKTKSLGWIGGWVGGGMGGWVGGGVSGWVGLQKLIIDLDMRNGYKGGV
jgi:hypothetical protein